MKETKINLSAFEVSEESLLMSGLHPGQPAVMCTGEEEDWPRGSHPSHPVTMAHPETATQACARVSVATVLYVQMNITMGVRWTFLGMHFVLCQAASQETLAVLMVPWWIES